MIDTLITDSIIIGSLILFAALLAALACWAMDCYHERVPLFQGDYGRPAPREAVPDLAPFPGDPEPMLAAPVPEPPAPRVDTAALVDELAAGVWGHGGDTAAAEESNWHKADGLALAEQIREATS